MRRSNLQYVAAAALAAIALAACSSSAKTASPATNAPTTTAAPTAAGARRPRDADAAAAPTTVAIADSKFGKILVDSKGMTLYVDENDKPGKPACTGACLQAWPPVAAPETFADVRHRRDRDEVLGRHAHRRHEAAHGERQPAVHVDERQEARRRDRPGRERLLRRAGERREVRPGPLPVQVPEQHRSVGFEPLPGSIGPTAGCPGSQVFGKKSDTMRSSTTGAAVEVGPGRLEVRDLHRPAPRLARSASTCACGLRARRRRSPAGDT